MCIRNLSDVIIIDFETNKSFRCEYLPASIKNNVILVSISFINHKQQIITKLIEYQNIESINNFLKENNLINKFFVIWNLEKNEQDKIDGINATYVDLVDMLTTRYESLKSASKAKKNLISIGRIIKSYPTKEIEQILNYKKIIAKCKKSDEEVLKIDLHRLIGILIFIYFNVDLNYDILDDFTQDDKNKIWLILNQIQNIEAMTIYDFINNYINNIDWSQDYSKEEKTYLDIKIKNT